MKKKIIIIIVVIISLFAGVFLIYTSDYYRADKNAIIEGDSSDIIVTEMDYAEHTELVFKPKVDADLKVGFIFYPGGKVEYTSYTPLMGMLAESGITCILVEMPHNIAVLDKNVADKVVNEYPDITHWFIGGHSLGGAAAALFIEKTEKKFDGLILLAAYSSSDISDKKIPVLLIYGENDGVLNRETYAEDLKNLPDNYTEFVIEGGNHSGFGCYGEQDGDGAATISGQEQQLITADEIMRWVESVM